MLVGRVHQCGDEVASAAYADLVEYGFEVVLHGVGADVEIGHDLAGCHSLKDESGDAALGWREPVRGEEERRAFHSIMLVLSWPSLIMGTLGAFCTCAYMMRVIWYVLVPI